MGNWKIVSVSTSGEFYNHDYFDCSKTAAIITFNRENPYLILLNIIEL